MLARLLHDLGEALFPARCLACGGLFPRPADVAAVGEGGPADGNRVLDPYFCPLCRDPWTAVTSPLCSRCGVVFRGRRGEDHLCGRCLEEPGGFTRARAAGVYDRTLRTAIQALKFRAAIQLADPLGRLLHDAFRRHWSTGDIDLVAPVPLHRRRFQRRGFNQAWLLIHGWRTDGGPAIVRDLLVRTRHTAPQRGLDRRQRRANIRGAFSVRRSGKSAGRRVLLVDDVLTTGATVEACAQVLLRDGAERVDVLTLARAL